MSLAPGASFTVITFDTESMHAPAPLPKMHHIVVEPADTPVNSPVNTSILAIEGASLRHRCMFVEAFVYSVGHPLQTSTGPTISGLYSSSVMVSVTLTAEFTGATQFTSGLSNFAITHSTLFCVNGDTM
jgi:hypothetical protein